MRKIFLLSGLITLFYGCGEKVELSETEDVGTVKNIDYEWECHCDSLSYNADSLFALNDSLFTGKCFAYYPMTDSKYIEKHILKGQLHGRISYFDKQGEILVEEEYTKGVNTKSATGSDMPCNCSDLTLIEASDDFPNRKFRDNLPYSGKCYEYYPETDVLYMELNYRDGVLHGYSKYFDKQGEELYMEEYNKGELKAIIN